MSASDVSPGVEPAVPHILKVPDEILLRIFESLPCDLTPTFCIPKTYKNVSLSFVCRRFNNIITPIIYQNVEFSTSLFPHATTALLHRTFKENPLLRRHVYSLVMRLEGHFSVEFAMDFSKWLPNIKRLVVRGKFWGSPQTWPVALAALKNMLKVENLTLGSDYSGPCLPPIFEIVGRLPHLKVLQLRGISEIRGAPWYKRVNVEHWKRPRATPPWAALRERQGTVDYTSLSLYNYMESPESLQHLTALTTKLEKFSFRYLYYTHSEWSFSLLSPILAPHKSTLTSIKIGCFRQSGLSNFDLTGFENLQRLSLKHQTTGCELEEVGNLLAPRLESFTWSFEPDNLHRESTIIEFQQPQEDWLRRLTILAVERNVPLCRIRIKYKPSNELAFLNEHPDMETWKYPWERLDALAAECRHVGILVKYDPPTLTREEFEEQLAEE